MFVIVRLDLGPVLVVLLTVDFNRLLVPILSVNRSFLGQLSTVNIQLLGGHGRSLYGFGSTSTGSFSRSTVGSQSRLVHVFSDISHVAVATLCKSISPIFEFLFELLFRRHHFFIVLGETFILRLDILDDAILLGNSSLGLTLRFFHLFLHRCHFFDQDTLRLLPGGLQYLFGFLLLSFHLDFHFLQLRFHLLFYITFGHTQLRL
mmetsp:Transcript_52724/g.147975  ORF Transcript_52724/g.147975 Transcript_52724/m.147975 type:complete len:205 (-) Transcript_52724:616-1230(-)